MLMQLHQPGGIGPDVDQRVIGAAVVVDRQKGRSGPAPDPGADRIGVMYLDPVGQNRGSTEKCHQCPEKQGFIRHVGRPFLARSGE